MKLPDATKRRGYLPTGSLVLTVLMVPLAAWLGTRKAIPHTHTLTHKTQWEVVTSANPAFSFCVGSKERMTVVCLEVDELNPVVEGYCVTSIQRPTECYYLGE